MRFRKKPVVVEASRWTKTCPHPAVEGYPWRGCRYPARTVCDACGALLRDHGWVPTLEGGHVVCPGDWIITGVRGEHYPCKPDIFAETYEPVDTGEDR